MCRITGFWDFNYKCDYDLDLVLTKMRDSLKHGGPDDAGNYIEKNKGLALANRRLAILDLSPLGHQPMMDDKNEIVVVFNGEIYNFAEIKNELIKFGYKFRSNSDTEVIIYAYKKWGLDCIEKFRGMFAIVIWDKREGKLILISDRVGVKPLYYYFKDGLFMFASELKAFHQHPKFQKELNEQSLSFFLQYGYIPSPYAIFKYTYKLEPASFLIVKDGLLKKEKYWEIENFFLEGKNEKEKDKWLKRSEGELVEELESLLTESFKLRLVSDVPVGMFLSGGIDSSTVCALLAKEGIKLKTFTIGFYEKEYNEAPFAKKVAEYLGTDHTEFYCTPKETFEIIPKLPEIYDEPFGDSSAIPTYFVSKLTREKVKVSLSADGGDEQFCGYTRYWMLVEKINKISKLPFKNTIRNLLNIFSPELASKIYNLFKPILPKYTNFRDKYFKLKNVLQADNLIAQYDLSLKIFLKEDLLKLGFQSKTESIFNLETNGLDNYSILMLLDLKTYLPDDLLVKVDRATMSVALEGREPFLDHKLLEWTSKLPSEFKYKNGKSKYLLRKVLYKYVPPELIERPKQGFGMPVYEWFKKDLKDLYLNYLDETKIKKEGLFNHIEVKKLLDDYLKERGVNHNKLWLLFIFEQWRERWL
jgi:asparagine synthase (glutamine-hydrolysing)